MTFGEKLVYYRTKKNMSQKALAEILDITPTRLNYWEKDKREPDISMVGMLAKALDVSANILIGLEEDEETKKSPAPEGTEDEEQGISELEEELRSVLLKHGLLRSGDLTREQSKFLKHFFALLILFFEDQVESAD